MILKSPPTIAIIGLKPFAPFIHFIWDKKCRIYFINFFCIHSVENKFKKNLWKIKKNINHLDTSIALCPISKELFCWFKKRKSHIVSSSIAGKKAEKMSITIIICSLSTSSFFFVERCSSLEFLFGGFLWYFFSNKI